MAKLSAVCVQVDVSGNLTGGSHIVGGLGAVGHSQSPVLCQIEIIVRQNFNPCTGSLILGSSVLGSSVLGLRILSPSIEDPQS